MHRFYLVSLLFLFSSGLLAQKVDQAKLGQSCPEIALQTVEGDRTVSLNAFRTTSDQPGRPVAIVFWSYKCPSGRRALDNGTLDRIYAYCKKSKIELIGICSYGESAADLASEAKSRGIEYTLLHDPDGSAADRLGAQVVTHSFLLDPQGKLVYTGGLAARRGGPALQDALEDVAAGREIRTSKSRARG
ncbi:MAG: redoxin domain-containing protein [Planctomycetota bacterium]|jgi:hypothetical protein|nr:redoxin domain-containing protein [Planctomycetota bacterium]